MHAFYGFKFFRCALFIPRGCRILPHLALMIPRVGLNWPPGMNRSLYLTDKLHMQGTPYGLCHGKTKKSTTNGWVDNGAQHPSVPRPNSVWFG